MDNQSPITKVINKGHLLKDMGKLVLFSVIILLMASMAFASELKQGERLYIFLMNDSSGLTMNLETCNLYIYNHTSNVYISNGNLTFDSNGRYYFTLNATTPVATTPYHAMSKCTFGGTGTWYSWSEFYLVSNRISDKSDTIYTDTGLNFTAIQTTQTAHTSRFNALDANLTNINTSISGLIKVVNGSLYDYLVTHTNRFNALDANLTNVNSSISVLLKEVNVSIITRGDIAWTSGAGALTTAQNNTLMASTGRFNAVDANLTDINKSITEHGDVAWTSTGALTSAQNATLNAISVQTTAIDSNVSSSTYGLSALKTLIDAIKVVVDSIELDVGLNFTSIFGRFNAVDGNLTEIDTAISGLSAGISTNTSWLDTNVASRHGTLNTTLVALTADMGINFTGMEGRFNAVDGNLTGVDSALAGLSADLGANTTYLNDTIGHMRSELSAVNVSISSYLYTMASNVWASATRTLTAIDFNIFGNWSTFQDNVAASSMSNVSIAVWNYGAVGDRNVTSTNERGTDGASLEVSDAARYQALINNMSIYNNSINNAVVTNVGNMNNSISDYLRLTILTSIQQVKDEVWNYTSRWLTNVDFNVFGNWSTLQNNVAASSTSNITKDVWNYQDINARNVTPEINYSRVAYDIWTESIMDNYTMSFTYGTDGLLYNMTTNYSKNARQVREEFSYDNSSYLILTNRSTI